MSFIKFIKYSFSVSLIYSLFAKYNTTTVIISGENNEKYLENIKKMVYKPPLFLHSFFPQVIMSEIFYGNKDIERIKYDREYINTPDNGLISIDYHQKDLHDKPEKLIVIMHGLTGGSESSYIKDIIEGLEECKHSRIACINYRGVNNTELKNHFTYHLGYTKDLEICLKHLAKKFPNEMMFIVGTSMGANITCKLITDEKLLSKDVELKNVVNNIKGFISISNPIDVVTLEKEGKGGILDMYLLKRWLKYVKKHEHVFREHGLINIDYLFSGKLKYYRDFDNEFTCKYFNFINADDYYEKAQCKDDISKIKITSLFINSLDDQLSPIKYYDLSICKYKVNFKLKIIQILH